MATKPFAGKVAAVTGGSRGIGRACVLKFAQLGADVVVNYSRSGEDAEATARDAEEFGGRAVAMKADMGERDEIVELFKSVQSEFGRLDLLVNSAARGLERPRGAVESLPKHLKHTMDVNPFWPWFCIRVNAVASGLVDGSDGIRAIASELLDRYQEVAPAGRLVKPEEVAAAVAFLCGADASMIVGHVLQVDGGYSLVGLV